MKQLLIRITAITVSLAVLVTTGLSAGAFTAAADAPSQQATASATAQTLRAPVTGTTANGGTFRGAFSPTSFVNKDGQAWANGRLTGTLTRPSGTTAHVDQVAQLPIANAAFVGTQRSSTDGLKLDSAAPTGSCQILNLVLGPLDLNLLGLVVHLNRVHLNITAQTGPGNLLGNLLCAIAHLLDGVPMSGLLAKLVSVLNRILAALGG